MYAWSGGKYDSLPGQLRMGSESVNLNYILLTNILSCSIWLTTLINNNYIIIQLMSEQGKESASAELIQCKPTPSVHSHRSDYVTCGNREIVGSFAYFWNNCGLTRPLPSSCPAVTCFMYCSGPKMPLAPEYYIILRKTFEPSAKWYMWHQMAVQICE